MIEDDHYRPKHAASNRSRILKVATLAGAAAAVWIAALMAGQGGDNSDRTAAPLQGLACGQLREAVDHWAAGRISLFGDSIRQAARVALRTLDTSGQLFGGPERVALQLDATLEADRPEELVLERLLSRARASCMRLLGDQT